MKKAQVTVFILLGMVIVLFAGVTYYATELAQKRVEVTPVEASSAKELVELCLGIVADDALLTIGKQGGLANLGVDYFEPLNTAYLYDTGENKAPDNSAVEQQLSEYIDANLAKCLGNFDTLKSRGVEIIEKSQPKTTTTIAEKDVQFALSYDLEEKKGEVITRPEFAPVRKFARLKEMIDLAQGIVNSEKNNNGLIDLDTDCSLDVIHFPVEKTLVTVITDNNFMIQNSPYRFVFAHRR